MAHTDGFDAYDAASVPPVVARYLSAQGDDERRQEIAEAFTARGRPRHRRGNRLRRPGRHPRLARHDSEYTYTTALIGQRQDGPDQWTVVANLKGDFPGGVVDLRYRFSLEQDRISRLIIAP